MTYRTLRAVRSSNRHLMKVTVDDVMKMRPCWPDARKRAIDLCQQYRRNKWTALEILTLDDRQLSREDKLWCCFNNHVLPTIVKQRFIIEVVANIFKSQNYEDPEGWRMLDATLAYCRGTFIKNPCQFQYLTNPNFQLAVFARECVTQLSCHTAYGYAFCLRIRSFHTEHWSRMIPLLLDVLLRWLEGENLLEKGSVQRALLNAPTPNVFSEISR